MNLLNSKTEKNILAPSDKTRCLDHRSPQQKRVVPLFKSFLRDRCMKYKPSGQFSGEGCVKKDSHSSVNH